MKAIASAPIQAAYLKELYGLSLTKGAQATTAIEGNTLSEEDILRIRRGEKVSASKDYMTEEIENILNALNTLRNELIDEHKESLISPDLIRRFHFMVGSGLDKNFESVPGQFRQSNVVVGRYRPSDQRDVESLVDRFCQWSAEFFHYNKGQQFSTAMIQAIVTHVYLAWIHPFSDGNGRVARLLEFYLLLRGGTPDIVSHILPNHYNATRSEYYRQLESAAHTGDLTQFIAYSLEGLKDGLQDSLRFIQEKQLQIAWQTHIRDIFEGNEGVPAQKKVKKRQNSLALAMEFGKAYTESELFRADPIIRILYADVSEVTRKRDLQSLLELKLIKQEKTTYVANTALFRSSRVRI